MTIIGASTSNPTTDLSYIGIYAGSASQIPTGDPGQHAQAGGRNVNEIMQWFIDHVDSTAFYLGMSRSSWYSALNGFLMGLGISSPSPCYGDRNAYNCIKIDCGSSPCLEGYATESDCLNAVDTPCSTPVPSYTCSRENGICYDPGDGSGDFADLASCLLACEPCVDPVLTILTTDATTTVAGGISICHDDGTIRITASTLGATWEYLIEDTTTGIGVAQDYGIPSNSSTNFNFLSNGIYTITVTDNLGCVTVRQFTILCVVSHSGCPTTGPYRSQAGPGTSPHNIQVIEYPATNAACDNGSLGLSIGTLGNGATSITSISLYDVCAGSNMPSPIVDTTTYLAFVSTTPVTNLISNPLNCPYLFEVTDDMGCVYYYEANIDCIFSTPTYNCSGAHGIMDLSNGMMFGPYTCYDPVLAGYISGGAVSVPGIYTDATATSNSFPNALAECQDGCFDCPNDVLNMNPMVVGATCPSCNNGSITVKMDGYSPSYNPPPTTWNVSFWQKVGNAFVEIQNTAQTGLAIPASPTGPPVIATPVTNLLAGLYEYRIEDSNGCPYTYTFTIECFGCTDPQASNTCNGATIDDGSCLYSPVYGCTDPSASNYNPLATIDDGSCVNIVTPVSWSGCMNTACYSYNSDGTGTIPANPTPNGLPCYQDPFCINSTSGAYYDATECSCSQPPLQWCCGNY
jgi:hypothetical protein